MPLWGTQTLCIFRLHFPPVFPSPQLPLCPCRPGTCVTYNWFINNVNRCFWSSLAWCQLASVLFYCHRLPDCIPLNVHWHRMEEGDVFLIPVEGKKTKLYKPIGKEHARMCWHCMLQFYIVTILCLRLGLKLGLEPQKNTWLELRKVIFWLKIYGFVTINTSGKCSGISLKICSCVAPKAAAKCPQGLTCSHFIALSTLLSVYFKHHFLASVCNPQILPLTSVCDVQSLSGLAL